MPTVESQGHQISYAVHGEGTPVLLGHSFLCSGAMWAPQVEALADRARLINVDLRGHGASGRARAPCSMTDLVADPIAVLDELGIERAVWAGLSIGGMVAMRAALVAPERVAGLILIDTHAGAERPFKKLKYRAMGLGARLFGMRRLIPATLPLMFGATTRATRPALVEKWSERFASVDLPSILVLLETLVRRDSVIPRLTEIAVPSLVLVGAEDVSLPPSDSKVIAEGLQDAKLEIVPEAGHLSCLEQPEFVSRAIGSFLSSRGGDLGC